MIEEYDNEHYFELKGKKHSFSFSCTREEWGKNNHLMWLPHVDTEPIWGIDTTKAFRIKENCVKYMQEKVDKAIRDLSNGMWE